MKPFFQRPRPCHDETLKYLIINVGNCGGKYGFASSHAANTMGLAVVLFLRNKMIIGRYLLPWALIVSYSRIYLGVHYFGDVVVGWLIALFAAIVVHYILNRSIQLSINYN
jgi:undecaprenyl-diphosphatase